MLTAQERIDALPRRTVTPEELHRIISIRWPLFPKPAQPVVKAALAQGVPYRHRPVHVELSADERQEFIDWLLEIAPYHKNNFYIDPRRGTRYQTMHGTVGITRRRKGQGKEIYWQIFYNYPILGVK